MAVAAVTPRVRTIVICDDVSPSLTETGVFTLEGVRLHLEASTFPYRAALNLFLLLSSPRNGKPIRYVKFLATFDEDNELLPLYVEIGNCLFPEPGPYSFEVYFSARRGGDALKGEHPFTVLSQEE